MKPKKRIRRRTFIGSGVLTAGTLLTSPFNLKGEKFSNIISSPSIFASENGNLKSESLFVVGFVSTHGDIINHESMINDIRETHNYKSVLSYRSNDKFKLPFAKGVIDYFIETEDLFYLACLMKIEDNANLSPSALQAKKMNCYQTLIDVNY